MQEYQKVNINLKAFEEDYWEWVLKDYIRKKDRTKIKYISTPYKEFMKSIIWLAEYKINLSQRLWKYWTYLLSIQEYARRDNSINMNLFWEHNNFSKNQLDRLIKCYKDNWVLKKEWQTFFLNPLLVHYWSDIDINLWIMFKDELEKVWFIFK